MTELEKAARMALEALEDYKRSDDDRVSIAMHTLRSALDQPASGIKQVIALYDSPEQPAQQEPVAVKQMLRWVDSLKKLSDNGTHMKIPSGLSAGTCWELAVELEQFIKATRPQAREPEQPAQQEPLGYWLTDTEVVEFGYSSYHDGDEWQALYTRPQAREWVGLTDGDWAALWEEFAWESDVTINEAHQEEMVCKHGEGHYYMDPEESWNRQKDLIQKLVSAKLKEKNT